MIWSTTCALRLTGQPLAQSRYRLLHCLSPGSVQQLVSDFATSALRLHSGQFGRLCLRLETGVALGRDWGQLCAPIPVIQAESVFGQKRMFVPVSANGRKAA